MQRWGVGCAHLEQVGREVGIRIFRNAGSRISPRLNDLQSGPIVAHVSPNVVAAMELQEMPTFTAKVVDQLFRNPCSIRLLRESKPIGILADELEEVLVTPVGVNVS
jgi:hypothetical protein